MQDINLYHLLRFYLKKWAIIVLLTILGAIAGFTYSNYIQVPLYKSDATMLLVSTEDRKISQDSTLINNYIELISSRRVLEPVIREQNYVMSYEELVKATTATNEKNTEVIKVAIDSKDPQTSKKLVDGVVQSFRNEVKSLYNLNNISVVDNASSAAKPYNVNTLMLILLTTAAGFFAAVIVLFFVYDVSLAKKKASKSKATKAAPKPKTKAKAKATTKATTTKKKQAAQSGVAQSVVNMLVGTNAQSAKAKSATKRTKASKSKK